MGVKTGSKRGKYKSTTGQGLNTARKKMTVKMCPGTGGNPTRVTRSAWEKVCAYHLKRSRARRIKSATENDPVAKFCRRCKGKMLPKELEIIDKEVMPDGKA